MHLKILKYAFRVSLSGSIIFELKNKFCYIKIFFLHYSLYLILKKKKTGISTAHWKCDASRVIRIKYQIYAVFRVIIIFSNRIMCSLGTNSFVAVNSTAEMDGREEKVNCCWGEKARGTGKTTRRR